MLVDSLGLEVRQCLAEVFSIIPVYITFIHVILFVFWSEYTEKERNNI